MVGRPASLENIVVDLAIKMEVRQKPSSGSTPPPEKMWPSPFPLSPSLLPPPTSAGVILPRITVGKKGAKEREATEAAKKSPLKASEVVILIDRTADIATKAKVREEGPAGARSFPLPPPTPTLSLLSAQKSGRQEGSTFAGTSLGGSSTPVTAKGMVGALQTKATAR